MQGAFEVVKRGILGVANDPMGWFKLLLIPQAAIVLAGFFSSGYGVFLSFSTFFLASFYTICAIVAAFQKTLEGKKFSWFYGDWSDIHTRMLGWIVITLFSLASAFFMIVLSFIPLMGTFSMFFLLPLMEGVSTSYGAFTIPVVLFGVGMVVTVIYTVLRCSLVFPFVCIGEKNPLQKAWKTTEGNVLFLFKVFLLTLLASMIVGLVLGIASFIVVFFLTLIHSTAGVFGGLVMIPLGSLVNSALSYNISAEVFKAVVEGDASKDQETFLAVP